MMFQNKVALVTGGAQGIGEDAARLFAEEGACVLIADMKVAEGEAVAASIRAAGGRAIFQRTDVTNEADVKAMVDRAVSEFGGLDAAFNNAAIPGNYATAVSCTEAEWDLVMNVDLKAVWLCMKYEIPEMQKRGGGAIVNTASRGGDAAVPNMFSYHAAKHGVLGITRSAAVDFGAHNVRANVLMPGYTNTPMLKEAGEGWGIESLQAVVEATIPLKRMASGREQAEAAVWLCSTRSSYITGIALACDGGQSALP